MTLEFFSSLIIIGFLLISFSNSIIIQPFQVANFTTDLQSSYTQFLLLFQLLFCLLLLPIIFFSSYFFTFLEGRAFLLISFFCGLLFHDFLRKYFLARNFVRKAISIDLAVSLFQIGNLFVFNSYKEFGLSHVLTSFSISYAISITIGLFFIYPMVKKTSNFKQFIAHHYKEGKWLGLVSVTQWGSSNFIILAIGSIVNVEALGAFRLVQSLFGVLNIVFQTYENYVLPQACKLYASSTNESKKYIINTTIKGALLNFISLFFLFLFSDAVMKFVGGMKYIEYSYIIKGMCILYFILFVGYPIRLSLRMLLLSNHFFWGYLLAFIFSFTFFKVLITQFQIYGIIYGLIINQVIMLSYWYYQLQKNNYNLWK